MNKIKCIYIIGLLVGAMGLLTGCGSTTVQLNKYVKIEASGYESMGTASYSFDYDAFEKDYSGKIKLNSKSSDEISALGLLSGESIEDILLDVCVSQKLDHTEGLSNGDVVTLKWNCEDTLADEYFNCKLDYSDITYTVSGLEEVDSFNPFDYVEVSFSGISPNGSVTITPNYDQAEIQYINFTSDKISGLKNGDTITVKAYMSVPTDTFVEKFGSVPEKTEETYTVDSLSFYVSSIEDIPQDMMEKMISQGEDAFRAYVANEWDKPENLISVTFAGDYFLTAKTGQNASTNNMLYLVYKIQATNTEPEQTVDFYYYVVFDDIIKLSDGTCSVDLSGYRLPSSGWDGSETFKVGDYLYKGYEKIDSLFNNCVVTKIDKYEYTSTLK